MLYIYIYIYIYSHPQTDYLVVSQLFSVARHARFSKAGTEIRLTHTPIQDSTTQPRGNQHKRRNFKHLCITFVLFTYIRLTATESSIHSKGLALRERSQSHRGRGVYIDIYIYIYGRQAYFIYTWCIQ